MNKDDAMVMSRNIRNDIEIFDRALGKDTQIQCVVSSPSGMVFVNTISFGNSDTLIFIGVDTSGIKTQVIQHISQVNVSLRAVPYDKNIQPQKNSIGFTT